MLTLSRPSLDHTDPSGAAPWALIPLFLSLAWASRPLSLSLSISLARAGLAPPLLTWALLPHPCFAQAGAASLSPGRSLARDTPRMPQKPLVSVSVSLEFLSLYICVMGVK